jgi:hypothetical protein
MSALSQRPRVPTKATPLCAEQGHGADAQERAAHARRWASGVMWNTHKAGKVPHDSSTKVEWSQSFDVDGGSQRGSKADEDGINPLPIAQGGRGQS